VNDAIGFTDCLPAGANFADFRLDPKIPNSKQIPSIVNEKGWALPDITLGVVGVGHIGSRVVRTARALGMLVLQNDPPRREFSNDRVRPAPPNPQLATAPRALRFRVDSR